MSLRAAQLPQEGARASARVARVATLLDCDQSQIRKLVAQGALAGHRVGKRGIRIYLDSVADYQSRQSCHPGQAGRSAAREGDPGAPSRHAASTAAHRAALAELRARGIV